MDRVILIYEEVRLGHSFFLGPIGLGNWPHMLDNGPHLASWDVLSLELFVPGTFCLCTFCLGTFCMCIAKNTHVLVLYLFLLAYHLKWSKEIFFKT